MERITIIENDDANLWYYPEKKIVHHKFHKFIFGYAFRMVLSEGASLMEKYGAQKYLSEDTSNTVVRKEDSDWGFAEWAPRVIKAGWKYWAIVQPESTIAQINMIQFAKEYKKRGVTVQMFTDVEKALKWLESQ